MKTGHLDIRVEPALIDRIDAWCATQAIKPSRSAAITYIIEAFLNEHGNVAVGVQGTRREEPRPLATARAR